MLKRDLRHGAAIEAELGHMKSDGLLGRDFLKGVVGDAQNVILCCAGHCMRKILAHLRALLRLLMGEPRKAIQAFIDLLEADTLPQQALKAA
jgi:IS5 family transposase